MSLSLSAHSRALPVRRFVPILVAAALVTALSTPIFASGVPLTLAQAQRVAVERSRQLSAKNHTIAASREMAVAAGQLPDPVLRLGVDNVPVSGADRFSLTSDFMTMRRVGIMQELTRSDKRQWRAARFEREADKTIAEKNEVIANIQRDTALAWLDRYYAEAVANVIAEQAAQSKFEIQAAEGAYRAGRGNQADIFAARSALATFEDRASEAQRRARNAKTMLVRWVGSDGELPLVGRPVINTVRLDPASLEIQLAHHPRIAVLIKQEEVTAAEAKLAQANRNADWSVEVMYQQRGPAYSNMVSVGASVPLQWDRKNRQDREFAAKLAMVEQVRAEREEALRAHVAETRALLTEWENGRERYTRFEQELIPLANSRSSAAMAAYRGGKAMLSDVLLARRNEIDVRIQALQLQADVARVWAQLNFLFPDDSVIASSAVTTHRESK